MLRATLVALALAAPASALAAEDDLAIAIFAGGCFWCVEADYDKIDGVVETVSGYTGGTTSDPSYEQVTYGDTGHYEAVRVTYDPSEVDYRTLADFFFRSVDPTDAGGQFCDRGESYRTAIFVEGEEQRAAAEAAKAEAAEALEPEIVTPIEAAGDFYPAEDYHQDYYEKNSIQYNYYRWRCGRDGRVETLWGEDAQAAAKAINAREPQS
ncbi:MAG: peptide-methionine (S)-S-oxide reductase MsrA [Paracoccaceae bacterium]